jgi:hypothetical protein
MPQQENLKDLFLRLTTDGLEKRDYSRPFEEEGIRIETVIPSCFEGYAKIMIPWSMNVDAPDRFFKMKSEDELCSDETWDLLHAIAQNSYPKYKAMLAEIEAKNAPYYLEKQAFEDSIDSNKVKKWRPVTWKEVCEIYEAHYHNDISPLSFDYRYKGNRYGLLYYEYSPMRSDIMTPLFNILKKHTKSNLLVQQRDGKIEEISIHEYTYNKYSLRMDCLPKKREWISNIGHDSYCITIGGTYKLIDDLLVCKDLEVFECTPLSRVDWHSDKINQAT